MPGWQSSPVCAMDEPVILESVQVFADGNLRGLETSRQGPDQNPAVMLQNFQDRAAALFVQQTVPLRASDFRSSGRNTRNSLYRIASSLYNCCTSQGPRGKTN